MTRAYLGVYIASLPGERLVILSDQAGDYGRAEIETHNNLLFQSERLAILASFNPDIITIENDAGAPSALSLRRLTGTNTIQGGESSGTRYRSLHG